MLTHSPHSHSPTAAPGGDCTDFEGWFYRTTQYNCDYFAEKKAGGEPVCDDTYYGLVRSDPIDGTSTTLKDACCACGGGSRFPTPYPTYRPTTTRTHTHIPHTHAPSDTGSKCEPLQTTSAVPSDALKSVIASHPLPHPRLLRALTQLLRV